MSIKIMSRHDENGVTAFVKGAMIKLTIAEFEELHRQVNTVYRGLGLRDKALEKMRSNNWSV